MTALASVDDVSAAIERTLTTAEESAVPALVELASSAVESATGRLFAPDTYTVACRVTIGGVRLPATVASVSAVVLVDECDGSATTLDPTTYTLRRSRLYGLQRYRGQEVEVTFTVTAEVPYDIVALVAGVVAGRLALPAAGVTSELIGPNQVTFGNNSGRIYFSASDKAVIRRYRLPGAAIRLA